jgi:hypothetical protein
MSIPDTFKRATFTIRAAARGASRSTSTGVAAVTDLQHAQGRQGTKTKQFVAQSTGKLTMDLVFDTTHSGEDVRTHTDKIARFMSRPGQGAAGRRVPVGHLHLRGMVES